MDKAGQAHTGKAGQVLSAMFAVLMMQRVVKLAASVATGLLRLPSPVGGDDSNTTNDRSSSDDPGMIIYFYFFDGFIFLWQHLFIYLFIFRIEIE